MPIRPFRVYTEYLRKLCVGLGAGNGTQASPCPQEAHSLVAGSRKGYLEEETSKLASPAKSK